MELKNFFTQDEQGNRLPGATCYLYERGTENLVSEVWSANQMLMLNPFESGSDGMVQFAAENGRYDVRVVHGDRDNRISIQLNDVSADVAAAAAAAADAVTARDAAQLSAGVFETTALGLAATADGKYFSIPSPLSSESLILYKNAAGVAQEISRYPNSNSVQLLKDTIGESGDVNLIFSIADQHGFNAFAVDKKGGLGTPLNNMTERGIQNVALDILKISENAVQLVDKYGFVVADLADKTTVVQEAVDDVVQRNTKNLAASSAVLGNFNSEVQRPTAKYNHILMFGQSLSTSNEGWPALSKTPVGGNLMWGMSTRPNGRYVANFTPIGNSVLNPLKAVVQSDDGSTILTDAQVAALPPGAGNEGEGAEVAMTNFARKQFLQYHCLASDPSRLFVASSCGVSGRTIEQLSKGADPGFYLRLVQAAQGVKNIANAEGATYCIPAIVWMQGEFNYIPDRGGNTTKASYKAQLLAQSALWTADIIQAIADQTAPPAIITYQTGASFTRDDNDLSIGMAQWELSQEQPNWFMASPYYPYTDKSGHLDPNGYRWLGHQLGKVFHRVVTLGQEWKPLSPRNVTISGTEVLIDFHVPCPPLVWDKPYVNLVATDYVDKGFRVKDNSGVIAIRSVEIVAETVVKIVLASAPGAGARVKYASQTASLGNGCLRDSDPTVAMDKYQYIAGTGQYAAANIAALVDKPYPLHNWCIAFSLEPQVI